MRYRLVFVVLLSLPFSLYAAPDNSTGEEVQRFVVSVLPSINNPEGKQQAKANQGGAFAAISDAEFTVSSLGGGAFKMLSAQSRFATVELPVTQDVKTIQRQFESVGLRLTPDFKYSVSRAPNDPLYTEQWGMRRINAEIAWNTMTSTPDQVVAIIDTGIDLGHPDLSPQIFRNTREVANNGIDDDGNGFRDDTYGYNAVGNNGGDGGRRAPEEQHGTMVAGIIGAAGNNGRGMAGVNWNVKILPIRVLDSDGSGYLSDILEGCEYLARVVGDGIADVQVANMSFGGPAGSNGDELSTLLGEISSVLFVAAAGNNYGRNNDAIPFYPASYRLPNVVSVASSNNANAYAAHSNIGPVSVDLAAPGEQVFTTFPDGSYGWNSGTSFAAPFVTGTMSLYRSQRYWFSPAMAKFSLLRTARPIAALKLKTVTGSLADVGRLLQDDLPFNAVAKVIDFYKNQHDGDIPAGADPGYSAWFDQSQNLYDVQVIRQRDAENRTTSLDAFRVKVDIPALVKRYQNNTYQSGLLRTSHLTDYELYGNQPRRALSLYRAFSPVTGAVLNWIRKIFDVPGNFQKSLRQIRKTAQNELLQDRKIEYYPNTVEFTNDNWLYDRGVRLSREYILRSEANVVCIHWIDTYGSGGGGPPSRQWLVSNGCQ